MLAGGGGGASLSRAGSGHGVSFGGCGMGGSWWCVSLGSGAGGGGGLRGMLWGWHCWCGGEQGWVLCCKGVSESGRPAQSFGFCVCVCGSRGPWLAAVSRWEVAALASAWGCSA